jgi:hypothetical protein
VFVTPAEDGSFWLTGMAQGHYPIATQAGSQPLLQASPHLPRLLDFEASAVRRLVGQRLNQARALIAAESAR